MLFKLSFRNAKRTFSDYLIYMITVSLAIAMEFAFNRIVFIDEIKSLSAIAEGFTYMLIFASAFMMFVVALMIKYMVKFIVDKRSNEFGLYMLMGIETNKIKKIFWIEQILLFFISLVFGILLGILLGEVLKVIVYNFLGFNYSFKLEGFIKSTIVTTGVTLAAYLFSYVFSFRLFKKNKIIDWINTENKNEISKVKNKYVNNIIFICSLVLMVLGLLLLNFTFKYNLDIFGLLVSILLIALSVYGIASSGFVILNKLLLRDNKNFTNRVLSIRFIGNKINTMSKQLGTLAILFVLSLSLISLGVIFANYYKSFEDEYSKFDVVFKNERDDEDFAKGLSNIISKFDVKEYSEISVYKTRDIEIFKKIYPSYREKNMIETIIPLSVYNNLRTASGYNEISLDDNEFTIQTFFQRQDLKAKIPLGEYTFLGKKYKLKNINYEAMNTAAIANYYVVLNDEELQNLKPSYSTYLWNLGDYDYNELHYELLKYAIAEGKETTELYTIIGQEWVDLSHNISISKMILNEYLVSLTGSALSLLLIGLIFILVMCTVLSMNILSEMKMYKKRYEILEKIGVSKSELKSLVWKQIWILFIFPLILGLPVALVAVIIIGQIFSTMMTFSYISMNFLITVLIFVLIYLIYMFATYKTYKSAVIE